MKGRKEITVIKLCTQNETHVALCVQHFSIVLISTNAYGSIMLDLSIDGRSPFSTFSCASSVSNSSNGQDPVRREYSCEQASARSRCKRVMSLEGGRNYHYKYI